MTGRRATHCRHGHDIAVCGRDTGGHCRTCARARNEINNQARPCTGRPRTPRKWTAIEPALRAAWEDTRVPTPQLAIQFGLPSKNAVIGLAWRRGWRPRVSIGQPPRTIADRLDALARAFEACSAGGAGVSEQATDLFGSPLSQLTGDAEFSPCGKYRYWLSRDWGLRRFSDGREPYALWLGMNPSTATATEDDPTIRREMAYTRRLGLDRYVKVNVMDYRATNPKDLLAAGVQPCSDYNPECIRVASLKAAAIVVCHGKLPLRFAVFADQAVAQLGGKPLLCLGLNGDGSPKHPLYLRADADFVAYRP